MNKTANEVSKEDKDEVLTNLRALAKASNEELFQTTLAHFQNTTIWKVNKKLQNWMNTTWLPEKKVSFIINIDVDFTPPQKCLRIF